MPFVVGDSKKAFEKPDSGVFNGVLADIVDLGLVQTKSSLCSELRLVNWTA